MDRKHEAHDEYDMDYKMHAKMEAEILAVLNDPVRHKPPSVHLSPLPNPQVHLSKSTGSKLFPSAAELWATCRRTGGCDDGDRAPWDPTRIWVDQQSSARLKGTTFGHIADPDEDALNPADPKIYPDRAARAGMVRTLATGIREDRISQTKFETMSWAIVYGGLRLAHHESRPGVYTSFANSGMVHCFHDPRTIEKSDPMWSGAFNRGACVSYSGEIKLDLSAPRIASMLTDDRKEPGSLHMENNTLKFIRKVHGNEPIEFDVGNFKFRVMVFSPINPSPWTVYPWHQWLGFLVWDIDELICDANTPNERLIRLAPVCLGDGSTWYHVPHEDVLRDAGLDMNIFYGKLQLAVATRSGGRLIVVSSQNLSTCTVAWTHFHIISAEALIGLKLMTKCFIDYLTGSLPESPTGSCFNNRHAVAIAAMYNGGKHLSGPAADIVRAFGSSDAIHLIRSWPVLINPQNSFLKCFLYRKAPLQLNGLTPTLVYTPPSESVEALLRDMATSVGGVLDNLSRQRSFPVTRECRRSFAKDLLRSFGWETGTSYLSKFGRMHVIVTDPFFNDKDDPLAVTLVSLLVVAACIDEQESQNGKTVLGKQARVRIDARFVTAEYGDEVGGPVQMATEALTKSLQYIACTILGCEDIVTIDCYTPPVAGIDSLGEQLVDGGDWHIDWADDFAEQPVSCVWLLSGFDEVFLESLDSWGELAEQRGDKVIVVEASAIHWDDFREPSNVRSGWSPNLSDRVLFLQHENLDFIYEHALKRYSRFYDAISRPGEESSPFTHISVSMTRDPYSTKSIKCSPNGSQPIEVHGRPIKWIRKIGKDSSTISLPTGDPTTERAFQCLFEGLQALDATLADLCFRPSSRKETRGCSFADLIAVAVASSAGTSSLGSSTLYRRLDLQCTKEDTLARRQSEWHLTNHKVGSLRRNGSANSNLFRRQSSPLSPLTPVSPSFSSAYGGPSLARPQRASSDVTLLNNPIKKI